jgi:GlpG protein
MRVIETSLEEDLAPFSRYLRQQRVAHRIFEERGQQILEIAHAERAPGVRGAYAAWRAGTLELAVAAAGIGDGTQRPPASIARAARVLRRFPVLATLLGLSLLAFPFSVSVSEGELSSVTRWLTVTDLAGAAPGDWRSALTAGEYWRWLTPILLHFSVLHLLFNAAVVTELGRRLELARGSASFLGVICVVGVVSNLGQLLVSGHPLFGGLSGVGYGLLGYVLVSQRRFPQEAVWRTPVGFAFGLLIFLVIFSTGITEPFGLNVANAAHWFGLATGGGLALLRRGGAPSL